MAVMPMIVQLWTAFVDVVQRTSKWLNENKGFMEALKFVVIALGVAIWFQKKRGDPRFLVMFINGVICQAALELFLQFFGLRGPMGASAIVVRDLHLATVVRLKPYRRARLPVVSFDAWSSARTRGVMRALP